MRQPRIAESMNGIYEREHFVQFYPQEDELLKNLKGFIGAGLKAGEVCVVIATAEHRAALGKLLAGEGINLDQAAAAGTYVALDAEETLAKFMLDGVPDKERFGNIIGGILAPAVRQGKSVRAFGEMVALLWARDDQASAVLLEELWNSLGKHYAFTLFCAYPMQHFAEQRHSTMLREISGQHSTAITPPVAPALETVAAE